jgi:hypothetical protein
MINTASILPLSLRSGTNSYRCEVEIASLKEENKTDASFPSQAPGMGVPALIGVRLEACSFTSETRVRLLFYLSSRYTCNSAPSVRRSLARRFYDRQGILCPVDLVALTRKWIRVSPDSTKTLKLRLIAEVTRGLACHAAARHMPSRLGCAKHVHSA